jgi:antitoxin MazE
MTTLVSKWGNSLGLRIPQAIAAEAKVGAGDAVDVSVEKGIILVRPAARSYTIEELVDGITSRNRHRETDWGGPAGNESW